VSECDREFSIMGPPGPTRDCRATVKKTVTVNNSRRKTVENTRHEFCDTPLSEIAGLTPMLNRMKDFVLWEDIVSGRFCGVKSSHGHCLNVAAADCRISGRHKYHTDCIYDKILVDFIG